MSSSTTIPRRYGKFGLLRKATDTSSGGRREFCSAKLAASTPVVHWYAKTRDRWKRVFAFASVGHHQRFSAKSLGNTTCSKTLSAQNFRTHHARCGLRAKRHSGGWRDVRLAAGHLKGPGSYSASMLRSTRVGIPTTSIFCPTSPR